MKKSYISYIWKTVFVVCLLFWFGGGSSCFAAEKEITVYDGDKAQRQNYSDVSEVEHFYVGDSGQITVDSNWLGWYEEDEENDKEGNEEGTEKVPEEGTEKKPEEGNEEDKGKITWTYTSSDPRVVTVDGTGRYRVVGGGYAVVTVEGKTKDGVTEFSGECEFYCCADISGASLVATTANTYNVGFNVGEKTVGFRNLPNLMYYTFSYSCAQGSISDSVSCTFDPQKRILTVHSWRAGSAVLSIALNNQAFILTVKTSNVKINKISAVIAKKKTVKLKIKGYPGKIKWKTTKKKIVKISKKGVVKGKKTGNTIVYAEIDGNRIGCVVSVVSAKRKKVIDAAKKIARGTYSQPKRMSKGYYDCSSLVWRAYQKEGKKFGSASYAPVAADICKWCMGHKKKIKGGLSAKNIQKLKLRPGDLMFETGADNGRYKGVYHVEMVVGLQCDGFDSNGNPYISVCWAARMPGTYGAAGFLMARP